MVPVALPGSEFHAFGDLDGDGDDDLAAVLTQGAQWVYRGGADGLARTRYVDLSLR